MRDVLGRMLALVSGATRTVARLRQTPLGMHLGRLLRPGNGNRPDDLPWAADNGAFAGFDAAGFERLLQRLQGAPGCRWVAAPDVVADAPATLDLFREWAPRIRAQGFPVALVAQDGAAPSSVPWDDLDAVFIGGSTAWKTSPHARALVEAAQDRGKTTHMGRVNTLGRLAVAQAWGVDSVDGTNFSRFAEVKLPRFLGEIDRLTRQQHLW